MSVLITGVEMPESCGNCWALDDYCSYLVCRITKERRIYTFLNRGERMDNCPLVPDPLEARPTIIEAEEGEL